MVMMLCCSCSKNEGGKVTETRALQENAKAGDDILSPYRGKVLVLLMGMPGCSGTEKATEFLSTYAKEKPSDAAILRIDVPGPDGELSFLSNWKAPFNREIDTGRKIADRLDFFYYPTLYILDRDGEVRFAGECKPEDVKKMVSEICSEKQGSEKHSYMPPMPKIGDTAAGFTGAGIDKAPTSLDKLSGGKALFLFFGSTACPFSRKATDDLPGLISSYGSRGISFAIVHMGAGDEKAKAFYAEKAPGVPVVIDESGSIGEREFGVTTVPFFYLLDNKRIIVERQPFTAESAKSALNTMLGIKIDDAGAKKPGAG